MSRRDNICHWFHRSTLYKRMFCFDEHDRTHHTNSLSASFVLCQMCCEMQTLGHQPPARGTTISCLPVPPLHMTCEQHQEAGWQFFHFRAYCSLPSWACMARQLWHVMCQRRPSDIQRWLFGFGGRPGWVLACKQTAPVINNCHVPLLQSGQNLRHMLTVHN